MTASAALAGVVAGPAQATAPVKCGDVITTSTTLQNDVGPCSKTALIVEGSGITLNLNGHTVTGLKVSAETAGVLLEQANNSTVKNGTVTEFDAGVVIDGGSGNTVTGIDAHDNINDNTGSQTPAHGCNYGDGITAFGSSANTITNNTALHNGPYSGISLVGASDGNTVSNNLVQDNNVPNSRPNGTGNCGAPFSRPIQDIGIRVEGPGASNNTVVSNRVINSAIGGITIHGYVYNPPGGGTPDQQNTGNLIKSNFVDDTGQSTYTVDPLADGIAVLRQGPGGVVGVSQGNTIQGNTVLNSYRDGIFLGNPSCGVVNGVTYCQPLPYSGNTVIGNTVQYSLLYGIAVPKGSVNNTLSGNTANLNATFDAFDGNLMPPCDNNSWSGDSFGTVNQSCVK